LQLTVSQLVRLGIELSGAHYQILAVDKTIT